MPSQSSIIETIEMDLSGPAGADPITVYIQVWDSPLSRRWLAALNQLLQDQYLLEKNYCWFGWAEGPRNGAFICSEINAAIADINRAGLGYEITDVFCIEDLISPAWHIAHDRLNRLHRYFEDLQGQAGRISSYYTAADAGTRWAIRQLNLLCHEFESWALSWRKLHTAPEWQRPSQLMCWLGAPRFELQPEDLELFGIETINRCLGGVYVGVNKAVGKHHWEVFCDEGRDSRIGELTTSTLATQTLACGDFDIEWANNPGQFHWQQVRLKEFRSWLECNGFDPEDPSLTIGHPQVAQVDLLRTFGTENYAEIWSQLNTRLNVQALRTTTAACEYPYHWANPDYKEQQIKCLG